MLPTNIEDEDVSEKPSNMANEVQHMTDSNNNDAYEEEKFLENERPSKLLDSRLRDYPEQTTPHVLECVINQRSTPFKAR